MMMMIKMATVDLTIRFSYDEASSIERCKVPLQINSDHAHNEKYDEV